MPAPSDCRDDAEPPSAGHREAGCARACTVAGCLLPALAAVFLLTSAVAEAAESIAPKVLVITMFADEAKPWREGRALDTRIAIPGLPAAFPEVACDVMGLCLMTTAMGFANAAASTAVVAFSDRLDLTRTYVLIAGIGGVDPDEGTTGGAYWARFAVDGGLRHAIDPRRDSRRLAGRHRRARRRRAG